MERTADPASSGSLSTSITHDPAVHESADQKDLVLDIMEQVSDQESASGRQSWASEEPHQTEEDDEGWMVTPLETLEARRRARVTADEEEGEAVDMEDVEASVREALRLLEDSDGLEDTGFRGEETDEEQWTEGRQDGYLDFVHEAMEAIWTVEDRERSWRTPEEAQEDLEQEEMEEEEEEEPVQTHSAEDMKQVQEDVVEKEDMKQIQEDAVREEDKQEDAQEEDDKQEQTDEQIHEEEQPQQQQEQVPEDEWQEAYTAKGRVYYYNRRTRESSWKMPSQYTASKSLPGNETVHDSEKDEKLHSSVLRQSLGYHPSASVSSVSTMERQTTLFCNFCGEQQPCDRLAAHFYECATAKFHKRRMSTLYSSFERALVLLSEDATLRSLHYATSFADPTPRARPGAATMQDNLLLLRPKSRRSGTPSKQDTCRHRTVDADDKEAFSPDRRDRQVVDRAATKHRSEARRKRKSPSKKKSPQPPNSVLAGSPEPQQMETCRYCSRSFAEGRLAKHEAVCPRVFGNEGSWGRGTPSVQFSPTRGNLNSKSSRAGTPPNPAESTPPRSYKLKDHTLQQSYKEHQATLVVCPCCQRKFAPSGAQQHIAICKSVQNRPKNPIPLIRDYAVAG